MELARNLIVMPWRLAMLACRFVVCCIIGVAFAIWWAFTEEEPL